MYNETVIAYCQRRDTIGPLPGATHFGSAGINGDGTYMALWLSARQGRILRAAYSTIGCPSAIACGSWTAAWLAGRTLAEARALTAEAILAGLGGLPAGKTADARLTVAALASALDAEGGEGE
ncbi:MAG: iron-sulfur cluster assembly scaffold protein [Armatimonadetes bacterium]|nr:iron-sulfur cluster assembly scaffold protein [Armatimonadota bacterium]